MIEVFDDPALGRFTWDAAGRDWCGSLALPSGRVVPLRVSPQTDDHADRPDSPAVFEGARPLVAWLRAAEREAHAAVADALVGLYNRAWSEEGPITAAEFARRVELVEVMVPSSGDYVNLWFTDGDMEMFGSHNITAYFGADGRLRTADLSG